MAPGAAVAAGGTLTQHQWTVFGVAVSPDGKYLVSSEGTRINVWDLATRSILYIIGRPPIGDAGGL